MEQERVFERKEKRHNRRAKKRRRDDGDDDDEGFVDARVPVNLLQLLSLLAVSLKLSVHQQHLWKTCQLCRQSGKARAKRAWIFCT